MRLILLVYDARGSLETGPDTLAEFLGNGAEFLPLLMEFLEFGESGYHVLVLGELFGRLAELLLGLEILLEIEVAQFVGDLHLVVEALHVELVVIVEVTEIGGGNRTGGTPAVLQGAEGGEEGTHVFLAVHQGLELFHYAFLDFEVLCLVGVLFAVVFGLLLLVVGIKGLEILLYRIEGFIHHGACLAANLSQGAVEGGLDGLGLMAPRKLVFAGKEFLEDFAQLCNAFACKTACGRLDLRRLLLGGLFLKDGLFFDFFAHLASNYCI